MQLKLKTNRLLLVVIIMLNCWVITACGSNTPTPLSTSLAQNFATTTKNQDTTTATSFSLAVPPVADAQAAKQYAGTTIVYVGDSVGAGPSVEAALIAQFTKDTGIAVKVIPHPTASDDYYAYLQRIFLGQSSDVDVMMLDVVWPGALSPYLLDLTPTLNTATKDMLPETLANDTIKGKLVAVPYFGDYGMLYYRADLLKKYGFSQPPQTWQDLELMATLITNAEKSSNPNLIGFTWQGKAYEGLTCDALEWLASSGAGTIIDPTTSKVTINTQSAAKALARAKSWIGTISPVSVTNFDEAASLQPFLQGNAIFMRNWPYAYAVAQDPSQSKIVGKFAVAPLPHDFGGQSVGTLGGWQLGINRYSKNQGAAIEFVRYMTSPEVAKYRAITGAYVPVIKSVLNDPDVIKAEPFLATTASVVRVARPSTIAGSHYNQVSNYFFQGVSQILAGQDALTILGSVQSQIQITLNGN